MFEKSRVRGSFDKWHGEQSEALLKSKRRHLYHIYWSLGRQLSWKKSLLMICKILGLFVNLLTGDEKYSLLKRRNLLLHIPMHLSKKRKIFSRFVFDFDKFKLNFENFPKKGHPTSPCIFEVTDSRKRCLLNV